MLPFREALNGELLTSPTRAGTLSLEVAPRYVTISLAGVQLAISEGLLTITRAAHRRIRRVVRPLGGRLFVARGLPSEGVGLWLEIRPGEVERVFGAEPRDLIAHDGLAALRQLDRLIRRMASALSAMGRGVRGAVEVGPAGDHGLDKVLVADFGDHLTLYRRSLFRSHARRVLDAYDDGRIEIPSGHGTTTIVCRSRFMVQVIGDYLRFTSPAGDDLARVSLPWIAREDRGALAERIGEFVERHAR